MNVIAGIVDKKGKCVRVVVDRASNLHFHINKGERVFVFPNIKIDGNLEWNNLAIIPKIEKYAEEQAQKTFWKAISQVWHKYF